MVRKGGHNIVPTDDTILENGDAVLVVAEDNEAIATAAAKLGKLAPGRLASDRADLDYIRVFVGKASVVGIPLASLPMPAGYPTHLLHVRRYDADLVPAPDLMLEFGDRVGVLAPPERKEEIRRHFGDTVKATAEFSYVSLGLGMVMGVLLGLIPIPIPGVGIVTLGIGGGPLIVALILGKLRRTGPMLWTMPLPANIVLRNFGLAMFLATVGVNAGQPFVRTVAESGFTMLFIGVAVLLTTVFIVLLVGHYLMKIPYDDLVGVASGATGNPAILVYSTKMAPTERPDIGYAMIFPSMTLVKVIAAQIVGLLTVGRRRLAGRLPSFHALSARGSSQKGLRRYGGDAGWTTEHPRRSRLSSIRMPTALPRSRRLSRKSESRRRDLPPLASFMLAVVAGGSIGLGALYYTIVASDAELSFATVRVLGGLVFSLGLALVIVGGAELFTGNNLIVMAWASRKVSTDGDAAQLAHRLPRQSGRRARTCRPGSSFPSSRHERRPHRPVDIEHGRRKDSARFRDAVFQRHPVQRACLPGGLACLCGAVGYRQDRRAHIAGLRLHRGRLRALRRQHVFPAAGVADDQHGQRPGRISTPPRSRYPGSSTTSFRSRLAISWAAPAWSAPCIGLSIEQRSARAASAMLVRARKVHDVTADSVLFVWMTPPPSLPEMEGAASVGVRDLSLTVAEPAPNWVNFTTWLHWLRYRWVARSLAGRTRMLFDLWRHIEPFMRPDRQPCETVK